MRVLSMIYDVIEDGIANAEQQIDELERQLAIAKLKRDFLLAIRPTRGQTPPKRETNP